MNILHTYKLYITIWVRWWFYVRYIFSDFFLKGEDVRWTEMVFLWQELGARDLSRRNHPGREMGRIFLEGRIVRCSETEPIHCVEEKKLSLLGQKRQTGLDKRARKASRPNCHNHGPLEGVWIQYEEWWKTSGGFREEGSDLIHFFKLLLL